MAKEINLVPDIKDEFIKALKFRNFVFFLCIVVASVSMVVMLIFLSISGGQQGFINAKQNTISLLEEKINSYSELSDFLTIRDQLSNIATITESKTLMSRAFNVLSAIIPTGADTISISELNVALESEEEEEGVPTFTFDAQANSGTAPYIDYTVLDSFKKSMQYMRYDYGEYVDKNDQVIPAYCMIEKSSNGSILKDPSKGYYAYWLIDGEGCNPSAESTTEDTEEDIEEDAELNVEDNGSSEIFNSNLLTDNLNQLTPSSNNSLQTNTGKASKITATELSAQTGYKVEEYNGQNVVLIWRTPQYADWYKTNPGEDEAYMDLDGTIHNVPHFNSSCIKYAGTEKDNAISWTATNDACKLVPDGVNGIVTSDSSNGRDSEGGSLVLRFSAVIKFAPEVFNFNNHHMIALSPSGSRNVTDSYTQIQNIFVQRASDCKKGDTECFTTPTSGNSSSNNNSNNSEEEEEEEEEEE